MTLLRSVLITPAESVDRLRKSASSAADVCWIECEDGIHSTKKADARSTAVQALTELDWSGKHRVVRVNPMYGEHGPADIRAITPAKPNAFVLAKVQDPAEIKQADAIIAEVEAANGIPVGTVKLWAMIETAKAVTRVDEIATAAPRMEALFLGGGDLSADLRVKRTGLGRYRVLPELQGLQVELLYSRSRTVVAARAAGIAAIDVAYLDHADEEGTYRDALYSFQLGFDGKMVVSPRQIPAVHRAYAPSEEDLTWSRDVLKAYADVNAQQRTITTVDGEMVDGPFVRSARLIDERQKAIDSIPV